MNLLANLSLRLKLYLSFGATSLVLILVVGIGLYNIKATEQITSRVIDLRAPTAKGAVELVNGLNASLANLRGYMLLGKDQFKSDRAANWQEQIEPALEKMTEFSQNWTVSANKEKLARIKQLFAQLKQAQVEIEEIYYKPQNLPAQQLLVNEAMPQANIIVREITAMIDAEMQQESNVERKKLLGIMADVRGSYALSLANIRAFLLTGDANYRQTFDTTWAKNSRRFSDLQASQQLMTSAQATSFGKLSAARTVFAPLPPQMFDIRSGDAWNVGNSWLGTKAAPLATEIESLLSAMAANQAGLMQTDSAAAKDAVTLLTTKMQILLGIGLLLSAVFAFAVTRAITKPINLTLNMIEELGRGNLDLRLDTDRHDEMGKMATAMNTFADNMRDEVLTAFNRLAEGDFSFKAHGVISKPLANANQGLIESMLQVQEASDQISSGAVQVADSSTTLANGATQQAAALEEISASMTQMNEQTSNNAANAATANQLVGDAKQSAEKGNQQMQSMVNAMGEIKDAGQNISKIIKVIDEIAFQTNLLALNAAVEAARAGQHGKGFAVVAEEVRNLAARSAKAAQETTALIEGSVEKTDNGAHIADQTAAALSEIVDGVTKVSDLVAEIAAASHEQSLGIEQVNAGLHQLEDVNQQATSTSEESAAIAEELSSQTETLQQMLSRFNLGQNLMAISNTGSTPETARPVQQSALPSTAVNDNWGGIENSHEIKLDDDDFGKY